MGVNPLDYVGSIITVSYFRNCSILPHRVKIERWSVDEIEDLQGQTKKLVVLWFNKHTKGLALNWTNATAIADALGVNTDDYINREIDLDIDKSIVNPNTKERTGGVRVSGVVGAIRRMPYNRRFSVQLSRKMRRSRT